MWSADLVSVFPTTHSSRRAVVCKRSPGVRASICTPWTTIFLGCSVSERVYRIPACSSRPCCQSKVPSWADSADQLANTNSKTLKIVDRRIVFSPHAFSQMVARRMIPHFGVRRLSLLAVLLRMFDED